MTRRGYEEFSGQPKVTLAVSCCSSQRVGARQSVCRGPPRSGLQAGQRRHGLYSELGVKIHVGIGDSLERQAPLELAHPRSIGVQHDDLAHTSRRDLVVTNGDGP
jgi:hypothetical protein